MITVSRPDRLDPETAEEVRALLEAATADDAEAGFSTAIPAARSGQPPRLQVVARLDPMRGAGTPVVAYLRMDDSAAGVSTAQLVVHPRYRSLGVGTLLLERVGPDLTASSNGPRLDIWAHGVHPAAERMARRFGAVAVGRVEKHVAALAEWDPATAPRPAGIRVEPGSGDGSERSDAWVRTVGTQGPHAVAVHPRDAALLAAATEVLMAVEESGRIVGRLRASPGGSRTAAIASVEVAPGSAGTPITGLLIGAASSRLKETGTRYVELYVDPASAATVALIRHLGFAHDQSDVCFRLAATLPRIRAAAQY